MVHLEIYECKNFLGKESMADKVFEAATVKTPQMADDF